MQGRVGQRFALNGRLSKTTLYCAATKSTLYSIKLDTVFEIVAEEALGIFNLLLSAYFVSHQDHFVN
jgi:hypothetical protein